MAKKYLPSHKRANDPPPMRLMARDKRVVLDVYRYRVLSSPQVEALHFPSSTPRGCRTSCQTRLQLLFHHRFLDRLPLPIIMGEGRAPFVYALDKRGADLVASLTGLDRGKVRWKPKHNEVGPDFITHRLAVNTFRIVMKLAAAGSPIQATQWIGDAEFRTPEMKAKVPVRTRGRRSIRNYPDGYFSLGMSGASSDAHFFLEVDRDTMSHGRWEGKIEAYREFRARGHSLQHFGTKKFRLLTVTTSEKRLRSLKRVTEKAGGGRYFWFTTDDHVDIWEPQRILGKVWWVAGKEGLQPLFPSLED